MIEVFASVASIIGLSLQVYEKFALKHGGDLGRSIGALKVLSEVARPWKTMHQNYHPLSEQLAGVIQVISEYRQGFERDRKITDISGTELENLFSSGLLGNAVYNFKNKTQASVKTLQHIYDQAEANKNAELQKIRSAGKMELAENLEQILISQENLLSTHNDFITFLDKIREYKERGNWQDSQKQFILQHKPLLQRRVPDVINDTDRVLMALLEFYNEILDSIK